MNLYAYVTNNPANKIDPSGLDATVNSGPGTLASNVIGHNLGGGQASTLTFTLICPKCCTNLINYQFGYSGSTPPGATVRGHDFPDSFSTLSISSADNRNGKVTWTIVTDCTTTTTIVNNLGFSSIEFIFLRGICSDTAGPTYRKPGLVS